MLFFNMRHESTADLAIPLFSRHIQYLPVIRIDAAFNILDNVFHGLSSFTYRELVVSCCVVDCTFG